MGADTGGGRRAGACLIRLLVVTASVRCREGGESGSPPRQLAEAFAEPAIREGAERVVGFATLFLGVGGEGQGGVLGVACGGGVHRGLFRLVAIAQSEMVAEEGRQAVAKS